MRQVARAWICAWMLLAGASWAQSSPEELVRSTADEVLAVMRENKDPQTLIALAEQKILPRFDFGRMTRLAVGRPWRDASIEQQKALEQAFRRLLVNTYSAAISQGVTPADKVDVRPAQSSGDEALVRTLVYRSGKPPVRVDYRLARKAGEWMVYDVTVEDVSLVQTYRGSFSEIIGRSGIDGLIRQLQQHSGVRAS